MSWITLDEAKTRLGIDCTDPSHDTEIQSAIDYAIAIVEEYCLRQFDRQSYSDTFFMPSQNLFLTNWPVVTVDEIDMDGEIIADATYKLDTVNGVVYFDSGLSQLDGDVVKITYTAGYDPIPTVLLNATMDVMTSRYYSVDDDPSQGPVKMERIDGSVTVAYDTPRTTGDGPLAPYIGVLQRYRSERTQGYW